MSDAVRSIADQATDHAELSVALSVTKKTVWKRARREGWRFVEHAHPGGKKRIYQLADLPADVVEPLVLLRHQRQESPAEPSAAGGPGAPNSRQADGQAPASAALSAVSSQGEAAVISYSSEVLWRWYNKLGEDAKAKAQECLRAINAGLDLIGMGVPKRKAWEQAGKLIGKGRSTVQRWEKTLREEGYHRSDWLPALAPKYQGRASSAECAPEVWDMILNDYLRPEAPAAAACFYRARLWADERGLPMPSDRTLLRWLEPPEKGGKLPVHVRVLAREGVDALNRMRPAQRRCRKALHSMAVVNADGHKFDVMCRWADGYEGRPIMLAWQDVYSGKLLAYAVGRSESSDLVRVSWGRMVTQVGIPLEVLLDNGRAFASKYMSGGVGTRYRGKVLATDPEGVFLRMGSSVIWAEPAHGQSKPIERLFGEVAEYVSKHPICAGAYLGNSPTNKPANYGERVMPVEVFEEVLAAWVAQINAKPGRRGGICSGRSFNQTFQDGLKGVALRRATAEQRHLWMLGAVGIKARKPTGELHFEGNRYWDEALAAHVGDSLVVRFQPDDLHNGVIVETRDGRHICHAACIADTGFRDQAAAKESRRLLTTFRNKNKAALKALRSQEALEELKRAPVTPEPEPPIDHKVIAPVFGKRVSGSDVAPSDELDDGYENKLGAAIARFKENQSW